ncbi:Protein TIFY 6A [Cardamine amara subsp. amara]|uniref:Protein TIFY n=1 Tax=Cardamine amara subsp. amara TaxID=228776 RepID=A0ABD1A1K5_CARAN
MEIDFLGLGSKLFVKEKTNDDSAPSRGMMEWPLSRKVGSTPQFLSFGPSQQDRRINSVNDRLLPSQVVDKNRRTHYSSLQEVRMFPISSHHDQTTITASMSKAGAKSFINNQPLGGSLIMAAPTNIRSSSDTPPPQLTIFYAGSVSVYKDISPDKAEAIMLLAGNEPQAKPVSMSKPQNPVHPSPTTTYPPTMSPSFVPSISYIVSETGSGSNGVTMASLASTHNNQTDAFNMAPAVCLPQSRKASLARFLEKRKERIINVSPYYVDNKSSIECKTPMSECVSSPLSSSSSAIRPI